MISLKEAQQRITRESNKELGVEVINLQESVGRILEHSLFARFDQPVFTNSAMDGFAVRAEDVESASRENPQSLPIQSYQSAGSSFSVLQEGFVQEIATGAPLPQGADSVVMKEEVQVKGDQAYFSKPCHKGSHIRLQGEYIQKGSLIFRKGKKIEPNDLGVLASFGEKRLSVYKKVKVSYLATGNEIISLEEQRQEHHIYNSNAFSLLGLFQKEGCEFEDEGISPDEPFKLSEKIKQIFLKEPQFLILTGGVSVGKHDFVKEILEELGARIIFHKVSIKPGKPILFSRKADTFIFGLPGNPLSAQVGFYHFIYPLICKMQNRCCYFLEEKNAYVTEEIHQQKRHVFIPGVLKSNLGVESVTPLKLSSGNVLSLSLANCFISIPEGSDTVLQDTLVSVYPLEA
ncbi:MAG: molybdopterin molybdotransferase MoeA [Deltaproteobacteria bacterium]|nr:molybdopterin molybdotransferase MoeA [Deltaproteobacteria bacterium]